MERLAELDVKDGVDERVHERVHVAQPRRVKEGHERDATVLERQHANRVGQVTREKRHPAQQKYTCVKISNGKVSD